MVKRYKWGLSGCDDTGRIDSILVDAETGESVMRPDELVDAKDYDALVESARLPMHRAALRDIDARSREYKYQLGRRDDKIARLQSKIDDLREEVGELKKLNNHLFLGGIDV